MIVEREQRVDIGARNQKNGKAVNSRLFLLPTFPNIIETFQNSSVKKPYSSKLPEFMANCFVTINEHIFLFHPFYIYFPTIVVGRCCSMTEHEYRKQYAEAIQQQIKLLIEKGMRIDGVKTMDPKEIDNLIHRHPGKRK